mmetsp:Transcript_18802/g.47266  ORF Transcript_18802/g.47266 Transcript_18802/m.47266 type:complete len:99 (+) Transcript_18802:161-457(+)
MYTHRIVISSALRLHPRTLSDTESFNAIQRGIGRNRGVSCWADHDEVVTILDESKKRWHCSLVKRVCRDAFQDATRVFLPEDRVRHDDVVSQQFAFTE